MPPRDRASLRARGDTRRSHRRGGPLPPMRARDCCGTRAPADARSRSARAAGSHRRSGCADRGRRRDSASRADVPAWPRGPRGSRARPRRCCLVDAASCASRTSVSGFGGAGAADSDPWHCLNFLPLPHGQGSLRPAGPAPRRAAPPLRGASAPQRGPGSRRGCGARSRRLLSTGRARCNCAAAAGAAASARSHRRMRRTSVAISSGGTVRQKL